MIWLLIDISRFHSGSLFTSSYSFVELMNNYCGNSSEFLMALSICSSKTEECSTVENKQICRPRRVIHQEQLHVKTLVRLHTFYSDFQLTPFIQSSSWPTALLPVQQLARRRCLPWADDFFGALGKSVKTKVEYDVVT